MRASILKFGGSSSADSNSLEQAVNIVYSHLQMGERPIVVMSAMGRPAGSKQAKVTDQLLQVSAHVKAGELNEARQLILGIEQRHDLVQRQNRIWVPEIDRLFSDLEEKASAGWPVDPRFHDYFSPALTYAREIHPMPPDAVDDLLASYGERVMAHLVSELLNKKGMNSFVVDTSQEGRFTTNSNFKNAEITPEAIRAGIASYLIKARAQEGKRDAIPVYTGFVGRDSQGMITTLGRDGSNYTAIALAAAIKADGIYIYSDEQGVLCVPPAYLKGTQTISRLSYAEVLALAKSGVKVFQPNSLRILRISERLPPIYIRSANYPDGLETLISPGPQEGHNEMKGIGVQGNISFMEYTVNPRQYEALINAVKGHPEVTLLRSELTGEGNGFTARLIISVDPGHQSARNNPEHYKKDLGERIAAAIGRTGKYIVLNDATMVTAVGDGIGNSNRARAAIETALAHTAFSPGTEGLRHHLTPEVYKDSIGIVVPKGTSGPVIMRLYNELKTINLAVFGAGKIGLPLLERIAEAYQELGVNVIGAADSLGFVTAKGGLSQAELARLIAHKKAGAGFYEFKAGNLQGEVHNFKLDRPLDLLRAVLFRMWRNGSGDYILVDATDSEGMLPVLASGLYKGMKIVTANKLPLAANPSAENGLYLQEVYKAILDGRIYNRPTVGANLGAPETLRSILQAEPKPKTVSVYMMPSGTLGDAGSQMDDGTPFSQGVFRTIGKGYTEPKPFTDFSGRDVVNKALILARMISAHYGWVPVKGSHETFLAHANSRLATPVDLTSLANLKGKDFAAAMEVFDQPFRELLEEAGQDHVLRYVAAIEPAGEGYSVQVGLRPVHRESVMGSTKGPDNVFLFGVNSERPRLYFPPGPGAGVETTVNALFQGIAKFAQEFRR